MGVEYGYGSCGELAFSAVFGGGGCIEEEEILTCHYEYW